MYRQKNVSTVQEDDPNMAFLDTLSEDNSSVWIANLIMNGKKIPFKLDTGAEVTAISKDTWKALGEPSLQTTNKQLFGPAEQRLTVLGQFRCHLSHKGKQSHRQAFVAEHLKHNLLGLPGITDLHLAIRTDSLQSQITAPDDVKKRFSKVFQGLGTLAGEYNIQLRPNAKLHAIFTPRHVPLPL